MSEATQARAAALAVEVKKDSLSQLQNGDWKLTLKVAAQDMPAAILEALPGTRYQTAFVEVDDVEQPVQRPEKTTQQRAKDHFEAMCQDTAFMEWLQNIWGVKYGAAWPGARTAAKAIMEIGSANELLDNREPWDKLLTEFRYRNVNQ